MPSLAYLSLKSNHIGTTGLVQLLEALDSCPLQRLVLDSNTGCIAEKGSHDLASAFAKMRELRVLSLNSGCVRSSRAAIEALEGFVNDAPCRASSGPVKLQELRMGENRLTNVVVPSLFAMVFD